MKWSLSSQRATIIAALIGVTFGSLGAVFLKDRLADVDRVDQEREALIREHIYGLQEAAEQLWYRVYNAPRQKERAAIPGYYENTTLFALGRTLAISRIIALKGRYPHVVKECEDLGQFLRQGELGKVLVEPGRGLRYYDRLALAESLMERDGGSLRVNTFLEHHEKLENGQLPEALLVQARELIKRFKSEPEPDKPVLAVLCELIDKSSACTGVSPNPGLSAECAKI